MKRYSTQRSKELFEKALGLVAGGVSSKSRSPFEGFEPYPIFVDRAQGSKIYDVDGNEYIDYLLALGPTILGNANPRIIDFVAEEMKKGTAYALPYELQLEVAERLIKHVPSFERVCFMNSGTEANQMNIRLARAHTSKNLVVKFEGCYHGWLDNVCFNLSGVPLEAAGPESNPQKVPATLGMSKNVHRDIIVLPWNNAKVLEKTIAQHKDEIAAVITEPYMGNCGCIPPKDGYLEAMRELTRKNNIVLIFDEVITGFRVGLNCAQGRLGVTPDLTTLGKAFGGGFPIAAYGGKKEIMDLIAKDKVLRAGTLNANRVVMAAAYAALSCLEEDNGKIYEHIYRLGERLMTGMKDIISRLGIRAIVQGLGSMFQVYFTQLEKIENYRDSTTVSRKIYHDFTEGLLKRGILVRPSCLGDIYISAAHSDEDIGKTLIAIEDVLGEMKEVVL